MVLPTQWSAVSACIPKCTEEWVFVMIFTLHPSSRRPGGSFRCPRSRSAAGFRHRGSEAQGPPRPSRCQCCTSTSSRSTVREALELFGQVLEDDVPFDGLQVPRRHGCECIPDSGDGDALRGHHEVVHSPVCIPPAASRNSSRCWHPNPSKWWLLVRSVDVRCVPQPDKGIHQQLRVVLLSLRPSASIFCRA